MRKLKNEELNRPTVEEYRGIKKHPLVIILDNVRSLNNVGSVFRTCDAFLIRKIYLCGITGKPPHREINKTALGATDAVAWEYRENVLEVIDEMKSSGYRILTIEQADQSQPLQEFSPDQENLAMVFGNEVSGVSEEVLHHSDAVIEIPQFGTKHSLNISVSIGIVIWHLLSKLKKI